MKWAYLTVWTPTPKSLDQYDIQLDRHYDGILGRHTQKSWHTFVTRDNQHLVSPEAIDFLDQCLR